MRFFRERMFPTVSSLYIKAKRPPANLDGRPLNGNSGCGAAILAAANLES
jgi:hypothetical protein